MGGESGRSDQLASAQQAVLRRLLEPAQYTSVQFATLASDLGVTLSVGRTGVCWDNVAESFFATIKTELLHRHTWPTRA